MAKNTAKTVRKQSQLKGLKPFKPGQSGNPHGRPHESKSDKELRAMIREVAPDIIKAIAKKAKAGAHNPANILLKKILPDMSSMVVEDKRDMDQVDDVSKLSEDQRRQIAQKESEIEAIKHGADGNKTPA